MGSHDVASGNQGIDTALARHLIDQVEAVLLQAEGANAPLEVDPQRSRLFELFVMADAAGFLADEAETDLGCDALAKELAARWDLARNIGQAFQQPSSLPPSQLARLRVLWSFMRMWMEWSYAWHRWEEFHDEGGAAKITPAAGT
jgi:hypothetical protein